MSLTLRDKSKTKFKNGVVVALSVFALVVQPLYGLVATSVAHALPVETIVRPDSFSSNGWTFYDDNLYGFGIESPVSPDSKLLIANNPVSSANDSGAAKVDATAGGKKYNLSTKALKDVALEDITNISFDTYTAKAGGAYLNLVTSGISGSGRLVFVPSVTVNTWSHSGNALDGQWLWSGGKNWPGTSSSAARSWSDVKAAYPNAKIKDYIHLRSDNTVSYFDHVRFETSSSDVQYNFELAANPVLTGENFNTHDGADYKGVNVGFNINNDFGNISNVQVDLYKDSELLATNTGNTNLYNLINNDGVKQLSTPFIVTPGTYTEEYWNLGAHDWKMGDKPTSAVVTVTGTNGTRSITLSPLTEPNGWNFVNLVTPQVPTNFYFNKSDTDTTDKTLKDGSTTNATPLVGTGSIAGEKFLWTHWDAQPNVQYHVETYFQNPDGSWKNLHNSNNSKPQPYRFYGFGSQGNGLYRIKVVAYSTKSGLHSAPAQAYLTYDTNSPVAYFTPDFANNSFVNSNFHVAGAANDNVKLKSVFFDVRDPQDITGNSWRAGCAGPLNLTYTNNQKDASLDCDINISNLVEGHQYLVRIHAGDYSGYGGGEQRTFTVDKTAPSVPVLNPALDGAYFNKTPIKNTWTPSTDAVSGVAGYQVAYSYADGHNFGNNSDWTTTTITGHSKLTRYTTNLISGTLRNHNPGANEQGPVTVWVRAVDFAGNVSDWSTPVTYTYDSVAPSVPTFTMYDANSDAVTNGYITTENFSFVLNSSSDVVRYQLKYTNDIAGAAVSSWSPNDISATGHMATLGEYIDHFTQGEGVHHFSFSACDAAGNCSVFSTPFTVTYDATGPAISANETTFVTAAGVITPNFTDDDGANSGNAYAWVGDTSNPDGDNVMNDATVLNPSFNITKPGSYKFTLTATDLAGNTTMRTFAFTYTEPTPPATNPSDSSQAGANNAGGTTTGGAAANGFTNVTVDGQDATDNTDDGVLGEQDDNTAKKASATSDNGETEGEVKGASDEKGCSKFLGICWYYWIPIVIVVAVLGRWLYGAVRNRSAGNG